MAQLTMVHSAQKIQIQIRIEDKYRYIDTNTNTYENTNTKLPMEVCELMAQLTMHSAHLRSIDDKKSKYKRKYK